MDRLENFAKKFTRWGQLKPGALVHNSVFGSFLMIDGVKKTIGNLNYILLECSCTNFVCSVILLWRKISRPPLLGSYYISSFQGRNYYIKEKEKLNLSIFAVLYQY
jgi:hypothetical protein